MKLRFSLMLIAFCSFISAHGTVHAATPTPTPTIELIIFQNQCGLADVDGADLCCSEVGFAGVVGPFQQKLSSIPILGRGINTVSDGIVGAVGSTLDGLASKIVRECNTGSPIQEKRKDATGKTVSMCVCSSKEYQTGANTKKLSELCNQYDKKSPEKESCIKCADSGGILTGLGCIKTDFSTFISEFLLRIGVGFGGIIALGCIIYSAVTIQTSQGNPETIQKAREQIKSCLFGLLLILFSVLILQIIGVNLLGLPGFK